MAPKPRGLNASSASAEDLVGLLKGMGLKSVRMAIACFRRWEELEMERGKDNLATLRANDGIAAVVAVNDLHGADVAVAERACRALGSLAYGSVENKQQVIDWVDGLLPRAQALACYC